MSFIAYYFHWSEESVLKMEHTDRRRWCGEISDIHIRINNSQSPSERKGLRGNQREISILDMRPTNKL